MRRIIILLLCIIYLNSFIFSEKPKTTFKKVLSNGKEYTLTYDVPSFLTKDSIGRNLLGTGFYYNGEEKGGGFVLSSNNIGTFSYKGDWNNGTEAEFEWAFYVVDGEVLTSKTEEVGHYAIFDNRYYDNDKSVYIILMYTDVKNSSGEGNTIKSGDDSSKLIGINNDGTYCGYPYIPKK